MDGTSIHLRYFQINLTNELELRKFPDNTIKTAKYNIFTFLPIGLLNQFASYFNIYFLIVTVILSIKGISGMSPGMGIGPFVFVIGISLLREGIEDFKKAKYDKKYNNSTTLLYYEREQEFIPRKWKDLKVGNIVKVTKNEAIPADILVVKSSSQNRLCYLETRDIDGEGSLKPREAVNGISHQISMMNNMVDLQCLSEKEKVIVKLDKPNKNIYILDGAVIMKNTLYYFTIDNILLRGGYLKNVDYVYGIVLYTGQDTKIMQNIDNYIYKLSSMEKQVNIIIIYIIVFTFAICIGSTLAGVLYEMKLQEKGTVYLFPSQMIGDDIILYGFKLFGAYFIIFNNIIPISLLITLEIVKVVQVVILTQDSKLAEGVGVGEKIKVLSFRLHEDLGNIRYIFSDKTGTLTKNEMVFVGCSIFTKLYDTKEGIDTNAGPVENQSKKKSFIHEAFDKQEIIDSFSDFSRPNIIDLNNTPFETVSEVNKYFFLNIIINHSVLTEYENSIDESNGVNVNIIKKNNYTISINGEIPGKIKKTFQGSNPDELTLVQAANELGIEYIQRVGDIITVSFLGQKKEYEVLHRFEFSSARLRSSILVKELNQYENENSIILFMKGADSVILSPSCLNSYSLNFTLKDTKNHIERFSKAGYRTLCYSMKFISQETLNKFSSAYQVVKEKNLHNKNLSNEVEKVISSIETEMTLLGVTSLEDKLQDNVKKDIHDFLEAGIHVWMLTGDKLETAESIAYSCRLFNEDTDVFKIRANTEPLSSLEENLIAILDQMERRDDDLSFQNMERRQRKLNSIKRELKFSPSEIQDKNIFNLLRHKLPLGYNREATNQNKNEERSFPFLFYDDIKTLKQGSFTPTNTRIFAGLSPQRNIPKNKNQASANEKKKSPIICKALCPNNSTTNMLKCVAENKNSYISHPSHSNLEVSNQQQNTHSMNNTSSLRPIYPVNKPLLKYVSNENIKEGLNRRFCDPFTTDDLSDGDSNSKKCNEEDVNDVEIIRFMQDQQYFHQSREQQDNSINSVIDNIIGEQNIPHERQSWPDTKVNFEQMRSFLCNQIEEIDQKKRQFGLHNFTSKKQSDWKSSSSKDFQDISRFHKKFNLKNFGLIIEGIAITKCIDAHLAKLFLGIISKCRSVVCCRCAPVQKSDIVNFVKMKTEKNYSEVGVTLAIGDGGNDVNMIKTADIGIGIYGKEGCQAAFNSDYAIGQFKLLKRLLFYHGRYFLLRNSYFIYYSFYKSVIYAFPNFWFIFFNGYSGVLIYDDLYYLVYNAFASNILISLRTMIEEDIDMNFHEFPNKNIVSELAQDIYREVRDKRPFHKLKFLLTFLCSLIHSCLIYYIPMKAYTYSILDSNGHQACFWTMSVTIYASVLVYQTVIIIEDTFLWNYYTFLAYTIHFLSNFLVFLLKHFTSFDQLGGITLELVSSSQFGLTLLISCAIALYPFLFYRSIGIFFFDNIVNNLRFEKYEHDIDKKGYLKKLEQVNKLVRVLAKFKKIYHNDQNFQADNYMDKRMKELVAMFKSSKLRRNNNDNHMEKVMIEATSSNIPKMIEVKEKANSPIIGNVITNDQDRVTIHIYNNNIINNIKGRNSNLKKSPNRGNISECPEEINNEED